MSVTFTTFGSLSMLIERSDGFKVLVDPYITKNPLAKVDITSLYDVDLILITHAAHDHFGDAPEIFKNSKAKLVGDKATIKKLHDCGVTDSQRIVETIYGDSRTFGQVTVRTVRASHLSAVMTHDADFVNGTPFGYVVMLEPNVTYYNAGDTCLYSDMKLISELYHPNVMSLGIGALRQGGAREFIPREAAMAVQWVGAQVAFPGHYVAESSDLEDFIQSMKVLAPDVVVIPEKNKSYEYTPYSIKAK